MMDHIRWTEFIYAYLPTTILWIVLLSFLSSDPFPYAILQTVFLLLYSYVGHLFAHYVSNGSLRNYNPHIFLHHEKSVEMSRYSELAIETVVNMAAFLILIPIQRILGIHLLSEALIIGSGLLYIAIHIFDYSIHGNEKHSLHHIRTFCNYEPEIFDTLFGTSCDPSAPYTPMTTKIVHAIAAFCVAYGIKLQFDLT
jgi:hypothetical protein